VEVLVNYLDAMRLFLKYFPDAAGNVINKLLELLTSLPLEIKVTLTTLFHSCFQLLRKIIWQVKVVYCLGRRRQHQVLGMQGYISVHHLFG